MGSDKWMKLALIEASKAVKKNEVPVGAILVRGNRVLAKGFNLTKTKKNPLVHAEVVVLEKAAKKIRNERILESTLYVTLEPCAMCAGAVVQARVSKVVYGAKDPKAGACGSVLKVLPNKKLNHRPKVVGGMMAEESAKLLRDFFKKRRKK